jgi:hypothetical protein
MFPRRQSTLESNKGKIPDSKLGRKTLFPRKDNERWMRDKEVMASGKAGGLKNREPLKADYEWVPL